MSFLMVTGKLFLCEICKESIQVEYEGGAVLTQIGDENVFHQIEYSKKLGQPNDSPEEKGFYLFDFGMCYNCYRETVFSKDEDRENIKQKILKGYQQAMEEKNQFLQSLVENFGKFIESRINSFEIQEMDKLIGGKFDSNLGDKYAQPSKKKRKLNQIFQQTIRDKVEDYFINCILTEKDFNSSINNFNDLSKTNWANLIGSAPKTRMSVFVPFDISQPENLNDYIQTDDTVRHPIKGTPRLNFFHQGEISLDNLSQQIVIGHEDIRELLNFDFILKSFKSRIENILIK